MARTANDLQLSLAYRLGENSVPSDSTEKTKRLSWLNEGYRDLISRRLWWFTVKSDSTGLTVANTASYTLPADYRRFIELRVNAYLYEPISRDEVYAKIENPSLVVTLPQFSYPNRYYIEAGNFILLPTPSVSDLVIKKLYYYYPATLTGDSSTTIIPDTYVDLLVAYAEGRYWSSITQRGKAADAFGEYEQIITLMEKEDGRQNWGVIQQSLSPSETNLGNPFATE